MNTHRGAVVMMCVAARMAAVIALGAPGTGQKIPVADFARSPDISGAKLAPDGKFMGYLFTHEGRTEVSFLNIATGKASYYNPGRSMAGSNLQMADFLWVSNERVILRTTAWGQWIAGLAAINRNTSGWLGLTGVPRLDSIRTSFDALHAYEVIYASGQDPNNVLLLDRNSNQGIQTLYPDVLTMDTTTGVYRHILKNPGSVIAWLADWEGEVRFGMSWNGRQSHLTYRETPTAPWQWVPSQGSSDLERSFVGLNGTGQIIHVAQAGQKGRWALFPMDLANQRLGAAIFDHDEYDILPPDYRPYYAGAPLATAVYSPKTRALLGIHYVTEGPRQTWFDPAMAEIQRQIDALHPDLVNMVVSMDHTVSRLLVLSWSAREPGIYTLVDLAGQKVSLIGRRMPWIKPEQMAEMYPVACQARDGLPLHGYLTLPSGGGKKNLPLVMLVHGGPWVRDVWGFDPVVQFIASRGYAVLQINYRGSIGYGQEFAAKGEGQIGGAIQDDLVDAVRWAIQQGVADPKRIAIMGGSFGGYSALFALAKNPELFRCGIDIAGVTDWPDLLKDRDTDENKIATAYWEKRVGSLKDESVLRRLAEVSPVNFAAQIKAPLLIIHGKEDQVVPLAQSKKLVGLLQKQGGKPTTLYLGELGHTLPHDKQGIEFLTELEKFLTANLGR